MLRSVGQGLFGAVAGISAAALADPLVEAASNAGCFGRGNFTDHSMLDVLPAALTAALLALLYVVVRARAALGAPLAAPRVRFVTTLPAVFAAQLGALYAMETLEQIAVTGHVLGGALWLGAPVAIALALHALVCVAAVWILSRALDAATRGALGAARLVRALLVRRSFPRAAGLRARDRAPATPRMHPLASRSGKRAPPLALA
jgi:hypothetical protein